jgi:hypothetical protein
MNKSVSFNLVWQGRTHGNVSVMLITTNNLRGETLLVFYYLCKSTDSVNRETLWQKLRMKGVNVKLTHCVRSLNDNVILCKK